MRSYNPNCPLISIHIPKCAGTSLTTALAGWFKGGFYRHYYDPKAGRLPPRRSFRVGFWQRVLRRAPYPPGICIHGHFNRDRGFGIADYYPYVDQFITLLRDPFDIAVSDYFYTKARGADRMVNGRPAPLAEAYRDFSHYFEAEGLHRHSYITNHMPETLTLDNYADVLSRRFVYIGIVEDLPNTMRHLASSLGFAPVALPHVNEAARGEPIAPGLREAFVRNHPLEYALYDYALAHYKD